MDKAAIDAYLDQLFDRQRPAITNRISGNHPEIMLIDYNPNTNTVDTTQVSKETFFNADYSDLENRIIGMDFGSGDYGTTISGIVNEDKSITIDSMEYFNDIMQFGYKPMFDMPQMFDPIMFNDLMFGSTQTYPVPPQKWVRSRSKYHEPRSAFLIKAKRKRNINKANRKRARNG